MFDESEWEGLDRVLVRESSWLDYIMADSNGNFPDYPINKECRQGFQVYARRNIPG